MKSKVILLVIFLAGILPACNTGPAAGGSTREGPVWVLQSSDGRKPLDGNRPTLTFSDGQISSSTGCNRYGGSYQISGNVIRLAGIFQTLMACLEPEGLMEQEQGYLALLQNSDRFEITGEVLTIMTTENQQLIFEIQQETSSLR